MQYVVSFSAPKELEVIVKRLGEVFALFTLKGANGIFGFLAQDQFAANRSALG